MADSLQGFNASTADWRKTIKLNKRRSYVVMGSYLVIYALIGILVDLFMVSGNYPQAALSQIFVALITFKITPFATIIMLIVGVVSILVAFSFHDKLMLLGTQYREVKPNSKNPAEQQLYNVVEEMKVAAGLSYMPKIYIIDADYMNAFASGYSEKSAMVAITRGLMEKLKRDELQAVMAHELSHIRHMDIKLTLMAAVLGNIMLIVIDLLFWGAMFRGRGRGSRGDNRLFFVIMILRFTLPLITMLLMLYLSRSREFMADAGCVELTRDNEPLARALLKISGDHQQNKDDYSADYQQTAHENVRRAAYIFDPIQAGVEPVKSFADSFSSHPSIAKRLQALGFKKDGTS